jgi:vancomycin resistance protein YoaR
VCTTTTTTNQLANRATNEKTCIKKKKEMEFYDRYDFLRSSLKYTQQQASVAVRDLEKNINTPEYKAKIVSDAQIKSATNSVSERWLSTNPDNVRFISDSITRVANTVYKIGGTEQQAVEYAKNFMDKNYRLDIFENLVPITS